MVSLDAIRVLSFLIPGFIASKVFDVLFERPERSEFGRIVEALIFSMLIYTAYAPIMGISPVRIEDENTRQLLYSPAGFALLVSLSVIIPGILAGVATNGIHIWIARKLRLTNRTGKNSVWLDVFESKKNFVEINLKDGRVFRGWPEYVGSRCDEQWIYLHNPECLVDGKWTSMGIHGVMLNRINRDDEAIEYINFIKSRRIAIQEEEENAGQ